MTKEDIKKLTFGNKLKKQNFDFYKHRDSFVLYHVRQSHVLPLIDRACHYIHRVSSLYDHTTKDVVPSFVNVLHLIVAKLLY